MNNPLLMILLAFAVIAFIPLAISAESVPVSETTKVVVEPATTQVITTDTKTVVTSETSEQGSNMPVSAQTTVIVEDKPNVMRDAITGEPVIAQPETEEDMSLRDKVRSKMED